MERLNKIALSLGMMLSVKTKHFAEASFCDHSKFFISASFPPWNQSWSCCFSASVTTAAHPQPLISSCWEFTLMNPLVLLSPSLYISPGLHVRLSTTKKGHPNELCSLFEGEHTLCCQGLYCWGKTQSLLLFSAFSSLYFARYSMLSDLLSHLYNTRSNKRLSNQEDRVF